MVGFTGRGSEALLQVCVHWSPDTNPLIIMDLELAERVAKLILHALKTRSSEEPDGLPAFKPLWV